MLPKRESHGYTIDMTTDSNTSSYPADKKTSAGRRWMDYVRLAALLLFLGTMAYGLQVFFRGNWRETMGFWMQRRGLLSLAFLLSATDVFTDSCIWRGLLRQEGIRPGIRRGLPVFLTGYAAMLMPLQLGRVFRATEIAHYEGCSAVKTTRLEVVFLYMVVAATGSVFISALFSPWIKWAAPLLSLTMVCLVMLITEYVFSWLPWFPLRMPSGYWKRPSTIGLALATQLGCLFQGTILYLVFNDVAVSLQWHQAVMIMTSNVFIGVGSGLPGGIGVTESYLGAWMYWLETPPAHLVVAVAAFRILTFWIWIPIGCAALLMVRTCLSPRMQATEGDSCASC